MITPRFTVQKAASLSTAVRRMRACCMSEKMTDMEMSEMGKEKPRKKVSSLSFSMVHHLR